jgi:phosphotriesterase-related protein
MLPPGVVDAHGHVWIDGVEGVDPDHTFVLANEPQITSDLIAFRHAGGAAVIDCMPPKTGRNLGRLAHISRASGIAIIASTGFHLRLYYSPDNTTWSLSPEAAQALFEREITSGTRVSGIDEPVRVGVIKTAHPGNLKDPRFLDLFGAALAAAATTGAAVLIHTERGANVEELVPIIRDSPTTADRIMLCHVDKRPDAGLHAELAREGFLLEYDTFLRPKYEPDTRAWPLIATMLERGLEGSIAFGLDLADPMMWAYNGAGATGGMAALRTLVAQRLEQLGADAETIACLLRENTLSRIALAAAGGVR